MNGFVRELLLSEAQPSRLVGAPSFGPGRRLLLDDRRAARRIARRTGGQLPLLSWARHELVVDCFAGGGGASTGIEAALGCDVDVALNHAPHAIAMHAANHPRTLHFLEDVWTVAPRRACRGRKVRVAWFSPDCRHHSKAKGGKPVSRKIRGLAWAVTRWAHDVRPDVIFVENVEEFAQWGPLIRTADGKGWRPDPKRKGQTFLAWIRKLERYGYKVEWRILVAADYGAPTSRKRLFVIARRDGKAIVWPEPTHGPGRAKPWRTAAEIIDWSIPGKSIFGRKKALAEKTQRRIAEGLRRYVFKAARPFIVPLTHGKSPGRVHSIDECLRTVTAAHRGELGVVQCAFVARTDMHKSNSCAVFTPAEPLRTLITGGSFAAVVPFLAKYHGGARGDRRGQELCAPLKTADATNRFALVCPTLVQTGYGERAGQRPRVPGLEKPLGTVVAAGQKHAVVCAWIAKHFGGVVGHLPSRALGTVTAQDHHSVCAAYLTKFYGTSTGSDLCEPLPTVTGQGQHLAAVQAFLIKYFGSDDKVETQVQPVTEALHTVTTKSRFGLVTIEGIDYQIVDITLRMLEPHELFAAQGFPAGYQLDTLIECKDRRGRVRRRPVTKTQLIALAGNSVCPPVAEALVRANCTGSARTEAV